MAERAGKASAQRSEKPASRRRMSVGHGALVLATALFVAALIGASLWVAVTAFTEKLALARGISQIIELVDMSRHAATLEANLGTQSRDDLVALLTRFGTLTDESQTGADGYRTLSNPWSGRLIAYTVSPTAFRIESVVPAPVCSHILTLLGKSSAPLGLKQIDAKPDGEAWREIYLESSGRKISANEIIAGCRSAGPITLALTFILR